MSAPATALDWKNAGNQKLLEKDYEGAIQCFSNAIELSPNDAVLYSNRSAAYASAGDYEKALKDGESAIQYNPEWSKAYGRKALALFHLNRLEDALDMYQKGLQLEPTSEPLKSGVEMTKKKIEASEAHVLGEENMYKNKWSNALPLLNRAIELDPTRALYYSNRAHTRLMLGDYNGSLQDAQMTTQLRPEWHKGYQRQAEAHRALGNWDAAISLFAHAVSLQPDNQTLLSAFNKCQTDAFLEKRRKEHEEKSKPENKEEKEASFTQKLKSKLGMDQ